MPTAIHRRVDAARAGQDQTVIARLNSGWVLFGTQQFLLGYCLLIPDPVVPNLNALHGAQRVQFLTDMITVGDALLMTTGALRINYAIFGNQEPALHAHVVPRYQNESPELKIAHPWAYDWSAAPSFDAAQSAPLKAAMLSAFQSLGVSQR